MILFLYIFQNIKLKHLHFREACPKGKNFDEVRTATERSPSGRPKEVPATEGSTFRYGCEGWKKLIKKITWQNIIV